MRRKEDIGTTRVISFLSGWLIAGVGMHSPQGQESRIAADSLHGEKSRALVRCIAQELGATVFQAVREDDDSGYETQRRVRY